MSRAQRGGAPAQAGALAVEHQGVNLLPESVRAAAELRRLRSRLAAGLLAFTVLLGGVHVIVLQIEGGAQRDLDAVRASGERLQGELAQYAEAAEVGAAVERATAARELGMGTEIHWVDLISEIESVSPPGTLITSFSAQGVAPAETSYFEAGDQLGSPGVAAISFSVITPTLPDTAAWLEALNAIDGLMDASFSTVSLVSTPVGESSFEAYTVASSAQVNVRALSGQYIELSTSEETS